MILVDTSIWVDHARHSNDALSELLQQEQILSHPFVIGELALGGFKLATLQLLGELPSTIVATEDEVLGLIRRKRFAGKGVGYVDAHLLASAYLTGFVSIWTRDKGMNCVADELGLRASVAERRLS